MVGFTILLVLACAACGDAECGLMETFCNCPEDCEDGEVGPTE